MAELKTRPTEESVDAFLGAIPDASRQHDCRTLLDILKTACGAEPKIWGSNIIGFGDYHYRYASGREGNWFIAGFSPRKNDMVLYLMPDLDGMEDYLNRLGKHRRGKGCLYLKRLSDVNLDVLKELVAASLSHLRSSV